MNDFSVTIDPTPRGLVVRLAGAAALEQAAPLLSGLDGVFEAAPIMVVLDLAGLIFINTLGLGVLVEFRRRLQEAGAKLTLAGASQKITELFERSRLVELFPAYPSVEHALDETSGSG